MPFKNNPGCSCCGAPEVCSTEHDFEYVQLEPIDMRTLYVEGTATADYTERVERVRLIADSSLISETVVSRTWDKNPVFTQTSTTLYTDRFGGGQFFKNVSNTHVSDTIISSTMNPDGITYTEVVDVLYSQTRDELRLHGSATWDQGVYARIILQYYRRRQKFDISAADPDTNNAFEGISEYNSHSFYPNNPITYKDSLASSTQYALADSMPDRHAGWTQSNYIPAGYTGHATYKGIPTSGSGCAVASSTYQFTTLAQWQTLFEEVTDQYLEVAGSSFNRRLIYFDIANDKFPAAFLRGVAGDFYFDNSGYTIKAPWTQTDSRYVTVVSGPYQQENIAGTDYDYFSGGANGSYTFDPLLVFTNGTRVANPPNYANGQTSRVDDVFTLGTTTYSLTGGLSVTHVTSLVSQDLDWGQRIKLELYPTKRSNIDLDSFLTRVEDLADPTNSNYHFQEDSSSALYAYGAGNLFTSSYIQDWYDDITGNFQSYPHPFRTEFLDIAREPWEVIEWYADANRWNVKRKFTQSYEALSYRKVVTGTPAPSMDAIEDAYIGIRPDYALTNDANAFEQFRVRYNYRTLNDDHSIWTLKKATISTESKVGTTCDPEQTYLCSVSLDTVDTDDATYNSFHDYMPASQQVSPFRDFALSFYPNSTTYVHGGNDIAHVNRTFEGCVAEAIQVRDPSATFPANHTHFAIRATFSGTLTNCNIEFKCWEADTSVGQVQTDTNLSHDTFTIAGIDFTDTLTFWGRQTMTQPEDMIGASRTAYEKSQTYSMYYDSSANDFKTGTSLTESIPIDSGSVPAWFAATGLGIEIQFGSRN
jgi:hypothetical protein